MATATVLPWDAECHRLKEMWDASGFDEEYREMLRSDRQWGDMIPIHVTITVETQMPSPAPAAAVAPRVPLAALRNTNPSLRLGNLSTASDIRTLRSTLEREFGAFGPLRDINMPLDRVTRNIRGFAFIEFRSPADAERAITALRGNLRIGERDIRVEYAASQRKSAEEMAAVVAV